MATFPNDAPIIRSARRVAIAVDSCSLLSPSFRAAHGVPVAQMRIHIGDQSFTDDPHLDFSTIYRRVAMQPETRAWVSAPVPEQWLTTIKNASHDVDAVICLTVAAGLSASYDSARVAADLARKEIENVDIRVVDSGTISGALKLLATEATRVVELGLGADETVEHIEKTKSDLRTIATLDELNRIHHIANTPRMAIEVAQTMRIKPVVTFDVDEFRVVAKPISLRVATNRMLREIVGDIGNNPARFVVLHVNARDRALEIAARIRESCDCQFMDISDFHPFIGLYAGLGAIGIAWQKLPPES